MTRSRRKPTPFAPIGIEIGTRTVDDPFEAGAKMTAAVNLRESPLDRWRAHGEIDGAQYAAGDRFRISWERSELGGARAIDPAKEYVDGGAPADPYSVKRMAAGKRLAEAKHCLGASGYGLVCNVVGERLFPSEMGRTPFDAKYISRRVRDALAELSELWGMVGRR